MSDRSPLETMSVLDDVPAHKRELAESIRRLIAAVVYEDNAAPDVESATRLIDEAAEGLRTKTRESSVVFSMSDGGVSVYGAFEGPGNPVAPPLTYVSVEGNEAIGAVRLGQAYQGPPGRAHGGVVAALLDQMLGRAAAIEHGAAVTASLTVNFRKATPLDTDLEIRARLLSADGRKLHMEAEIRAGDVVTAESTALLITVDLASLPTT